MSKTYTAFRNTLLAVTAAGTLPSIASAEQFSLVALPDTQFYSRYPDLGNYLDFENPFNTQTQWIADNAASRNIAFTMHLGDLVDQAHVQSEWEVASNAMSILDNAGLNYGVARGNHDVTPLGASNSGPTPFTDYFGPDRFAGMDSYQGSDPTGVNSYHKFQGGGQEFGVLFTDWRMDQNDMAWAQSTLDANRNTPTILISHQIIAPDTSNPDEPSSTSNGRFLWDNLIKDNDQVFMTVNGHHHGTAWDVSENSYGNEVLQMVVDYQFSPFNGAGYLRELVFDMDADTISASTFSPWIEAAEDAGLTIPPFFNVPYEIDSPQAKFTYSIDFDQRFAFVPAPGAAGVLLGGALMAARRRR